LFEPEADNAGLLGRNLALNGCRNCTIFQAAAGSRADTGVLHKAHHSNPGAHTLVEGLYSEGEVSVPIVTLDDAILPKIGDERISLVKMDIEGFELEALRGGAGILSRTDVLIIEFTPPFLERGDYDPCELWDLFDGFDAYRFEHGSNPVRVTQMPEETCDLLLISSRIHPSRVAAANSLG
jgi:FkbM family methyltransferase